MKKGVKEKIKKNNSKRKCIRIKNGKKQKRNKKKQNNKKMDLK